MTLGEWAFEAQHIPGSLNIYNAESMANQLTKDDEIVVYCSNVDCIASQVAYHRLVNDGYTNVRRFAGGLDDWSTAGYPLEGTGF
jgi:rhodanese-related sulfurtransferase